MSRFLLAAHAHIFGAFAVVARSARASSAFCCASFLPPHLLLHPHYLSGNPSIDESTNFVKISGQHDWFQSMDMGQPHIVCQLETSTPR